MVLNEISDNSLRKKKGHIKCPKMDQLFKIPFTKKNREGFKKQIHYKFFATVQQTK